MHPRIGLYLDLYLENGKATRIEEAMPFDSRLGRIANGLVKQLTAHVD